MTTVLETDVLDIAELLNNLETELRHTLIARQVENPLMIGIHTGGVWVAEIMHQRLGIPEPLGLLDNTFYRDDFAQIGIHPNVKPSHLPTNMIGRNIILIDDVFCTGRTIRAALNELFDYGRPQQVILAVLIEREGKQLPIRPDCVGTRIALQTEQRIKLVNPPLSIVIEPTGHKR
jgi:pyrimidine operon attenuation protein / uracil phosphoribosyltransferase